METGEVDAAAAAALDLAGSHLFGADPGRAPAVLLEAYERAGDARTRARLAAAMARCWAYAGEAPGPGPSRRRRSRHADAVADPRSGRMRWTPPWPPTGAGRDRRTPGARDPARRRRGLPAGADARAQAHLWLLTVAAETLDVAAMHRHVRALELLGEESTKAAFYAASRRLMLELVHGRTDTVGQPARVAEAGWRTGPPRWVHGRRLHARVRRLPVR